MKVTKSLNVCFNDAEYLRYKDISSVYYVIFSLYPLISSPYMLSLFLMLMAIISEIRINNSAGMGWPFLIPLDN